MNSKDIIHVQTCELTKEEFTQFLSLYPIPSKYHVMLPKRNQTIFDVPDGYARLYTHYFSFSNLRLLLNQFFCDVLQYFEIHISKLNPFGSAKLTTFIVMCKAYGCEPSVDLFMGFFNSFPGDYVVPANCPELLSKDNRWDAKSFGDKLPDNIHENTSFERLGRYPTSVRVFPDHILFMAGLKSSWEHGQKHPAIIVDGKEMAFRNFMYVETDDDLTFLPKDPLLEFGTRSPSVSISTKPPIAEAVTTGQLVENTADSGDSPHLEKLMIHPGSVAARIREIKCRTRGGYSKPHVKRKLVQGASSSRSTRAKDASSKDDYLFLTISDVDEGLPDVLELQNANAYNASNRRSRELPKMIDQIRVECDVLKDREKARDQECEELKAKCEAAMANFDKNLAVNVSLSTLESKVASLEVEKVKLESVESSLRKELQNAKLYRAEVVSKVVPYVAIELVNSDDMGRLVTKLVSASILYGRCQAFEEDAKMKEPFDIMKVKGYRSSFKQEHTRARNELATAIFPFLADVVADPHAPIEALLSKKPYVLQRPAPTRTHVPTFFAPS
ncbi:hypothetical protein Tco_0731204 [Tanacetum coccineum]